MPDFVIDGRQFRTDTFVALDFDAATVDSDDDLTQLLTRLVSDIDARQGREALAVWQDEERIAAVIQGDGTVTRFDGQETPQATQERRSRGKRPERRPHVR